MMRFSHFIQTLAFALVPCHAFAATVPGIADPTLAGMPDGTTASSGDVAPDHSPVLFPGVDLSTMTALSFHVTGSVSHTPSPSGLSPDGGGNIGFESFNGISGGYGPINSLLGVFLTDDAPNTGPAPSALDFSSAASRDFASLSPELKQVFFIGDGLNSSGDFQSFIVPDGATRLYLGTLDGNGWYNNSGAFEVNLASGLPDPAPVPLGASFPLLIFGLASLRIFKRPCPQKAI